MQQADLQQQIALTLLPHFGKKRIRTILKHIGSAADFFNVSIKELKGIPGISEKQLLKLNRDLALKLAEPYANYIAKSEFRVHFYLDETFPKRLNECADAPLLLYSTGEMNLNPPKTVSIVGTRNATAYGNQICEDLIRSLAGKDILVVSGLAYGIDISIHKLCVQYKLQTVAVLGHGLDRLYPAIHRRTAREMLEKGGLLTEFLPGTSPDRENFPMRNRIVAGMTDATIVVESGMKGGSLITAELANDYNRDVFAFPGDINREYSKGCNYLIQKNKAHLISSPREFLNLMEWEGFPNAKQLDLFGKLNEKEKVIVSCLKEKIELSFDSLINYTKLSFPELSGHLLNLEFSGWIKTFPGKIYRLTTSF